MGTFVWDNVQITVGDKEEEVWPGRGNKRNLEKALQNREVCVCVCKTQLAAMLAGWILYLKPVYLLSPHC